MGKTAAPKEAKDAAPKAEKPAAKEAPATRPQRVSALVNLTTTKNIEGQFDTAGKKVADLGDKVAEIEAKFADRPDHQFAVAAREAREDLAAAQEKLVDAKEKFETIGKTLRDFFA